MGSWVLAHALAGPGAGRAHAYSSLGLQMGRRGRKRDGEGTEVGKGRGEGREERGRSRENRAAQLRLAPLAARCLVASQLELAHSSPALFNAAGERDAH